jgi:asparagine synthase (glutamine-hydrolysing)
VSGIAGIYAYHYAANPVDCTELRRIRDHMAVRGPDGSGEWYSRDERVGLGHRRLAVLSKAERSSAQPMLSTDGKVAVTFDGRIYNYRQLRASLEAGGYRFCTDTDTEVLLHLYAEKGEAMVNDLRGMFAFGLWDAVKGVLLLGRDPYGIKPLYYADDGWTIRFASQVKALLAGGKVSRDQEPAGLIGFCLFGSVPEPFTTYQEIRALPAGSVLWVDRIGTGAIKHYFSIADEYCKAEATNASARDRQCHVREALIESVRCHLVADVPVGAFVSGGIDSGTLVGLMRDAGQRDIQTVTLAFEELQGTREDQTPFAEEIAAQFGTSHTTRIVTEREFWQDLPNILDAMDQPTIGGLKTWFLSKAAGELGLKVMVSGLGGDELFGSCQLFHDLPRCVRALAFPARIPWLGHLSRRLLTALNDFYPVISPRTAGLLQYGGTYAGAYLLHRGLFLPWEVESVIDAATARSGLRRLNPILHIQGMLKPTPVTTFGKVAVLESSIYVRNQLLRDTDWASTAHSVEIRVPLIDVSLLRNVASVAMKDARQFRRLVANSPRIPLPSKVKERSRTRCVSPIKGWLQRDKRIEQRNRGPALAVEQHEWARRWAVEVAAV